MTSTLRGASLRLFTAEEYDRLIEAGILGEDERVELLQGEIIAMAPIGNRHVACVNRLNFLFSPLMAFRRVIFSIQNPIHLDEYSEPQPDLVIARFRPDVYEKRLPTPADIMLLVEVADSTEEFDRGVKMPMYARAGVAEAWLVNLQRDQVEAYRTPSPAGYRDAHTYAGEERLAPAALPDFSIALSDLFPNR